MSTARLHVFSKVRTFDEANQRGSFLPYFQFPRPGTCNLVLKVLNLDCIRHARKESIPLGNFL